MRATIFSELFEDSSKPTITEVDLGIGQFPDHAAQERVRSQLITCFSAIWECHTRVIFEKEEVEG